MTGFLCRAVLPVVLATMSCAVTVAGEQEATKKSTCCFTNPRFAGTCRVEPGKDETCEKILAYLNIPASAGKDYCGNTDIRGGWKLVPCDDKPRRPAKAKPGR
jgi:hypothetical protein